jgi:hypothetical protein
MPTEAASIFRENPSRLAGDILWLGITAGACAAIVGIVCWSLSAELSSGAALGHQKAAVTAETSAGSAAARPTPTFGINPIPAPSATSTTAGEVSPGSSGGVLTTSIAVLTPPAGIKSPARDPIADQLPAPTLANHDALTPAPSGLQPPQSALASPTSHGLGPRRPLQSHQKARPLAPGAGAELVPR